MMQLFFRVEGNEHGGLGHLMRCFALSLAAQESHIECVFICNQASKRFLLSRHQWQGKIMLIDDSHWNNPLEVSSSSIRNQRDVELIVECMRSCSPKNGAMSEQRLVLDGYQFDHAYQEALAKADIFFAYLDDINPFLKANKNHMASIVINGAASAVRMGYDKNTPDSRLCLGSQYLLLRPEFINLQLVPIIDRHSLLICFGGADAQNHTMKMLGALSKLNFLHPVRIVTGAAYKNEKQLHKSIQDGWLSDGNTKQKISMPIKYIHDAQDMADIMLRSRLSISAAGGTQFELMCCYTPSFLVVVADNQLPAAIDSSIQGWCHTVDWRNSPDYIELAKQVVDNYKDAELLTSMQQRAYEVAQKEIHNGAENVLNALNDSLRP